MFLALKEIKKDRNRFLLIIGIVALISYLVFFLTGLSYGLAKANTQAVDLWKADKIVLKTGTNSNLSSSTLEKEALEDFKAYDISPINIARSVAYINGDRSKDTTIDLVLIGLDPQTTAYPKIIEGRSTNNKDEVLASHSLKEEQGLSIGDELVLSTNDRRFKVVGFSSESKYNVSPVIYTALNEASSAAMSFEEQEKPADVTSSATAGIPERINGILVHDKTDLSSSREYDVLSMEDFIMELPGYFAQVLTFAVMIGFLIMISNIVLAVFMFIITLQKRQTFGIMKVQGLSNTYIARSVILQTLLVCGIGVGIGLGLTLASEFILPGSVPFRSNYLFYGIIALLIIVISMLGASFSIRGVAKVDPLEVLS